MIRPLREAVREIVRDYTLAELEEAIYRAALIDLLWSSRKTAQQLGISHTKVQRTAKRYGIDLQELRAIRLRQLGLSCTTRNR